MVGALRLTHPFPSLLVALTTGGIALLASGDAGVAGRLALAMLGLQVSIGALNDLVDAPLDAGRKPGKPIPRGAATPATARLIAIAGLGLAVGLTLPSGIGAAAVILACAACGYAYDLRLSRTPWSWLPLAIALPLVPVYAWLGSTGTVPAGLVPVLPAGILAGAALTLANGLADLERDRQGRTASATVRLGARRSWILQTAFLAAAAAIAILAPFLGGNGAGRSLPWLLASLTGLAALLVGAGLGRGTEAARRERAWELEALGVALLAAGWLSTFAGPG